MQSRVGERQSALVQRVTQLNNTSSYRGADDTSNVNNKSVLLMSKLIKPAPLKPQREAIASNPFAMNTNHEEQDEPLTMDEDNSGFDQIETYQKAQFGSSKESLLNTMNIGNRGQIQPEIKAQGYQAKSANLLLSVAPDKRFKCSEFDQRPITKKLKKSGDQIQVCGPNGKCVIF